MARLDDPAKRWKFSIDDVEERKLWDRHIHAYDDIDSPYEDARSAVVRRPDRKKWFARLVIDSVIVDVFDRLDLQYLRFGRDMRRQMKSLRKALEAD
jgi:polyphosphate kinase 2 (PPK2 family)